MGRWSLVMQNHVPLGLGLQLDEAKASAALLKQVTRLWFNWMETVGPGQR